MNSQSNGDHEVHNEQCRWLPTPENRIYLGNFESCKYAVQEAKKFYSKSDGCAYCCSICHNS